MFASTRSKATRASATFLVLDKLVQRADVIVLQETHGHDADLDSVRRRYPTHAAWGSFCASSGSGGLVFLIALRFLRNYGDEVDVMRNARLDVIEAGRVAVLRVPSTTTIAPIDVVGVHLEPSVSSTDLGYYAAKLALATRAMKAIRREWHHFDHLG